MNERDILAQKDFAVKEALAKGREKGLAEGEAKGRTEGLAEGESRGREEGKRETAKGFLKEGVPIVVICKVTGLSQEEIQRL